MGMLRILRTAGDFFRYWKKSDSSFDNLMDFAVQVLVTIAFFGAGGLWFGLFGLACMIILVAIMTTRTIGKYRAQLPPRDRHEIIDGRTSFRRYPW